MKKPRREAFTPGASPSIGDIQEQSVKDFFVQQAHQQQPEIVLNLGNGKEAVFKLVVVQPEDIESKTVVFEGNARNQAGLNEFSLRDLIPSIRKNGMTFPAIGKQLPDGRYLAWDGSRRRKTCIITGQPYSMYITDNPLIDEQTARYLSEIANVQKQLSQYEQGMRYSHMLEQGHNITEIMKREAVSRIKVYQAREAFNLPEAFYHAHASGFDLGRPRIEAYRKKLKLARENGFEQEFMEFVSSIKPNELAKKLDLKKLGLKQAVVQAQENMKENGDSDTERYSAVLECQTIAELMKHPIEVEELGLADAIIRQLDKAAAQEITESFDALMPAPKDDEQHSDLPVFKGKSAIVTSTPIKGGMRMTLKKVPEEQLQEIEKMIADYLAEQESKANLH